ncbi:AbrB family transcriptional regulator [Marinithermus hydrothermalis]|uniref:Membrane protein AbrB duplication n=1 Tax=Marinithermus hydrothermalis (strain DSM 14884 / JCM 11576 / T1) TaxID=869210 RepID=F2NKJ8_MARHT|nr:AbrB family transcriptional regulator [Marinithermus hydrothermalis]AEB12658.1 membrane protein AbrB duplication [Marinithermus hydrothermalis DSM 14884]
MTHLVYAALWGVAGGLLAMRLQFPGGAVVGAMLGSGLYNLLAPVRAVAPPALETGVQIAVGIVVGLSFNRELLAVARALLPWALLGTLAFLGLGVLLAFAAARFGGITLVTGLFGFSPGGISGMAVLAGTEGANPAAVALFHFVRVVALFILVPLLARLIARLGV